MSTFADKLKKLHPNLGSAARTGAMLDHPFSMVHPNSAAHRAKFVLPGRDRRKVALDLEGRLAPPKYKIDEYLHRMPAMMGVISQSIAAGKRPFEQTSIVLVHHLTAEILGTLAALRALGCPDLSVVFVGYNEDAEAAYRPDLDDLPEDEFRCFILKSSTASTDAAEGIYSVARSFAKAPDGDQIPFDALDKVMKDKKLDFISAMRSLAVNVGLQQFARSKAKGRRCLVIEDGGYLAPILNEAALSGLTLSAFRTAQNAPEDRAVDSLLGTSVSEVLDALVLGTVEHTRNGYDRVMRVNLDHGRLAVPAFSIAVSYLKTQVESDIVAESILNAVTSVLYSHGYVFRRRNALVFGSRGNIGRRLMHHLTDRLDHAENNLIGCDLKVGMKAGSESLPDWQTDPGTSSVPDSVEKATYAEFDPERVGDLDVIIGITGGPTPGHPVLQVKDVTDWLVNGNKRELYLASGSSKTDEFPEILVWMDGLLAQQSNGQAKLDIAGHPATVSKSELKDAVSGRNFGSLYAFAITLDEGRIHAKNLLFLNNLMPVNFLFYGVATEVIDEVLAQIVSAAVALQGRAPELAERRLFAVDFDRIASTGVYGSRVPATDLPRPLPTLGGPQGT